MQRVICRTLFDITRTEVKHAFNPGRLPFTDRSGQTIAEHKAWLLARNQQRNWETLLQLLSLRTQPMGVTDPCFWLGDAVWWAFEFETEDATILALEDRPFGQIEQDCAMVPMLIGLREQVAVTPMLIPGINIVFQSINIQS